LDSPSHQKASEGPSRASKDSKAIINDDAFGQILEMDDEETGDYSFSKELVDNYLDQAITTFKQMDEALKAENRNKLAELGHFLKGSSAAIGIIKVQQSCEEMQHCNKNKTTLADIAKLLARVKEEHKEAEEWLRDYYAERESAVAK
jgi:HPt (histidine-containing phosphotransfer) domain-containing protein